MFAYTAVPDRAAGDDARVEAEAVPGAHRPHRPQIIDDMITKVVRDVADDLGHPDGQRLRRVSAVVRDRVDAGQIRLLPVCADLYDADFDVWIEVGRPTNFR